MNKTLIKKRFKKGMLTYHKEAKVQQQIAQELGEMGRPLFHNHYDKLLEIGCGTGRMTKGILDTFSVEQIFLNDLVEEPSQEIIQLIEKNPHCKCSLVMGDAETILLPDDLDGIVSSSTFQWFQEPAAFIKKSHGLLKENGFLLFSTFGPENLIESRLLSGAGLSYPALDQWHEMLSPYFESLKVVNQKVVQFFDEPIDVLHHLKQTGVTAVVDDFRWTKSRLDHFCKNYQLHYGSNGKVRLTWDVLLFAARKKEF